MKPPRPAKRIAPPPPLVPRELEGESEAVAVAVEAADTPPPPAQRLTLDPLAAELIQRAIQAAITVEIERVRASLAPPVPAEVGATPSKAPSSIRAAAKGTGKLGKWGVYASGALALIGQIIVWTLRPEYAGPIVQAIKLIIALAGHGQAPAVDPGP